MIGRARVEIDARIEADPRPRIPPTLCDLGGALGMVTLHDGDLVCAGERQHGPIKSIIMICGQSRCRCGSPDCPQHDAGVAIAYSMSIEEARSVAARLVTMADAYEAEAATQADAVISKARRS